MTHAPSDEELKPIERPSGNVGFGRRKNPGKLLMSSPKEQAAYEAVQFWFRTGDIWIANGEAAWEWQDAIEWFDLPTSRRPSPSALPKLNIKCKTFMENGIGGGITYLNVIRVEQEDDNSFTAVTDHWPSTLSATSKHNLGSWMSAALDDPTVCAEMKVDISAWFALGEPGPSATDAMRAAVIEDCAKACETLAESGNVGVLTALKCAEDIRALSPHTENRTLGENENYSCTCANCGADFIGHKRAILCTKCKPTPQPAGDAKEIPDDDDPQNWKELALAAISDLRRYAYDESYERRIVSAVGYEERAALLSAASPPSTDAMRRALEEASRLIATAKGHVNQISQSRLEVGPIATQAQQAGWVLKAAADAINAALTPPSTER